MYVRRKVYSMQQPEEQLYSVTMTEEQYNLFSEFVEAYYSDNDVDAAATAGGLVAGAGAAGAGAYYGGKKLRDLVNESEKITKLAEEHGVNKKAVDAAKKKVKDAKYDLEKAKKGVKAAADKAADKRQYAKNLETGAKEAVKRETKALKDAASKINLKQRAAAAATKIAGTKHGKAIAAGTAVAGGIGAAYGAHKLANRNK